MQESDLANQTTLATSTGTTIVGLKFGGGDSGEEEGICLGADTRATAGPIVADKNCEKVSCHQPTLRSRPEGRIADVVRRSIISLLTCDAAVQEQQPTQSKSLSSSRL